VTFLTSAGAAVSFFLKKLVIFIIDFVSTFFNASTALDPCFCFFFAAAAVGFLAVAAILAAA
jgi:hypothetical protein